MNNLRKMV